MLGNTILAWMHDDERTVGYLAKRSGIAADRLIDLMTGNGTPDTDEIAALAQTTGLSVEDLRHDAEASRHDTPIDPLRCYTVVQASALLGVSPDTVRKETRDGTLRHVVLGQRSIRIPRRAIEERLSPPGNQLAPPATHPAPPPQPQRSSPCAQARQLPLS